MDRHEEPVGQMLKVVTVLDVTPGHADEAETGEPIAIVTTAYRGEIEQPMLLNLRDARKLAVGLLGALATHGDRKAEEIMEIYYLNSDGGCGRVVTSRPAAASRETSTSLPKTGLTFTVMFPDRSVPSMHVQVLGGYVANRKVMVIYRCDEFGNAVEGIACLGPRKTIRFKRAKGGTYLPQHQWQSVSQLYDGYLFEVNGQECRKLGLRELRRRLHGRTFANA